MIFYFSGTGNSRYVAEYLSGLLQVQAVSIPSVMNDGNADDVPEDMICIVSPVYFYGLPTIVSDFISRTKFSAGKIFSVLTYGSTPGNASSVLKKEFAKKGIDVRHTFTIKMPENYTPLFRIPDEEERNRQFADAKTYMERIPKLLRTEEYNEKKGIAAPIMTAAAYPFYKHGRTTKKFRVTHDCTGCSLCERICPVNVISVKDGRPQWTADKCVRCLACIHRCPSHAIQIGGSHKREQYVNPYVDLE